MKEKITLVTSNGFRIEKIKFWRLYAKVEPELTDQVKKKHNLFTSKQLKDKENITGQNRTYPDFNLFRLCTPGQNS